MSNKNSRAILSDLIKSRRTRKPVFFNPQPPSPILIKELIECARYAPNHHRTEPARFYLMNSSQIKLLGKLFGEVLAGDKSQKDFIEKGKRKEKEWGNSPGILIVTCDTDPNGVLAKKKPELNKEDYATCCCILQNLLLLLEAEGISAKWSTGPVWNHSEFNQTVGIESPQTESVVALLFYGYSDQQVPERRYTDLNLHFKHLED